MAESSEALVWRKSSACGTTSCLEVACGADGILVRDSDDPDGVRLRFGTADWRAFLAGLRTETLLPPS
ncbi:DUF397 domain-containing protein [Dactylosporangium sp. NPDC000555]|uniref:DUF397 domain-containing protein n=1 Tax=Dactylosporangium sp. NPDC000555 TaxID=3154260 RepID=UPI003316E0FB